MTVFYNTGPYDAEPGFSGVFHFCNVPLHGFFKETLFRSHKCIARKETLGYRNENKIPMLTVGRVAGMTHANYLRESWIACGEFLCRFSKKADGALYYMGERV